jgi:Cu(I)/Ag(I) efflux system membrane protein CusA/SilA
LRQISNRSTAISFSREAPVSDASLIPILWVSGIGSDVMKPIAAPMVGGMITSTIHVLIPVPFFFVLMKERSLRQQPKRGE